MNSIKGHECSQLSIEAWWGTKSKKINKKKKRKKEIETKKSCFSFSVFVFLLLTVSNTRQHAAFTVTALTVEKQSAIVPGNLFHV